MATDRKWAGAQKFTVAAMTDQIRLLVSEGSRPYPPDDLGELTSLNWMIGAQYARIGYVGEVKHIFPTDKAIAVSEDRALLVWNRRNQQDMIVA